MKYCTLIVITSTSNPWLTEVPELRDIGLAMQSLARKQGGECLVWFNAGILTVAIQGLSSEQVAEALATWTSSIQNQGTTVKITQRDDHPLPEGKTLKASFGHGSVIRERLTRRLFVSLPEGAYIVSNIFSPETSRPMYAERLGPDQIRVSAWKRAVAAGASGRMCLVVWSEEDFHREINRLSRERGCR